jgi:hypothetical protein
MNIEKYPIHIPSGPESVYGFLLNMHDTVLIFGNIFFAFIPMNRRNSPAIRRFLQIAVHTSCW